MCGACIVFIYIIYSPKLAVCIIYENSVKKGYQLFLSVVLQLLIYLLLILLNL